MSLTLFLLATAAAAQPITVTGHAWAPFISPMGEPFRARSVTDDTLARWFAQADRNHDGVLTADEMVADGERFFATLDTNHDGQLDPDEIAHYEYEIAPDIQVMSKTRRQPGDAAPAALKSDSDSEHDRKRDRERRSREDAASLGFGGALQGAARYGLLNMPEPVAAADTDFNRAVTLEEFRAAAVARFQLLDKPHAGRISLAQLEAMRPEPPVDGRRPKVKDDAADTRIGNPLPTGP
jgi:Ca2+-binding EF-hand superfamily protein